MVPTCILDNIFWVFIYWPWVEMVTASHQIFCQVLFTFPEPKKGQKPVRFKLKVRVRGAKLIPEPPHLSYDSSHFSWIEIRQFNSTRPGTSAPAPVTMLSLLNCADLCLSFCVCKLDILVSAFPNPMYDCWENQRRWSLWQHILNVRCKGPECRGPLNTSIWGSVSYWSHSHPPASSLFLFLLKL